MTDLILLGAGASAFCGPTTPRPPPLGDGLFDELAAFSAEWRRLPDHVIERFRGEGKFEGGLAWIRAHMDERTMALLRDMALYFLRFRPARGSTYIELATVLKGSLGKVQLATLNYDLLLEYAMMAVGFEGFGYGRSGPGQTGLIPVHGSPHLLPAIPPKALDGVVFRNNHANINAPMAWRDPGYAESYLRASNSIAPGMALYAPDKKVLVGTKVADLQKEFAASCGAADRILICGVSYQPHDAHVWDPIAGAKAPVIVADPRPDQFEGLAQRLGSRLTLEPMGFDKFVRAFKDKAL